MKQVADGARAKTFLNSVQDVEDELSHTHAHRAHTHTHTGQDMT